jgi:hypothetical protein
MPAKIGVKLDRPLWIAGMQLEMYDAGHRFPPLVACSRLAGRQS